MKSIFQALCVAAAVITLARISVQSIADGHIAAITTHALNLHGAGYLLPADADAIILRAMQSDIGR